MNRLAAEAEVIMPPPVSVIPVHGTLSVTGAEAFVDDDHSAAASGPVPRRLRLSSRKSCRLEFDEYTA